MALPVSQLGLSLENISLVLSGKSAYLYSGYSVIHPQTGAVISSGSARKKIVNYARTEELDAEIYHQFQTEFITAKEWHGGKAVLSGHSFYDVDLSLRRWVFIPTGTTWELSHPISGTFPDQVLQMDDGRPTLISRFKTIVGLVLPPTSWAFADSPQAEELRVWCVQVPGASAYNVYDDSSGTSVLLGQVPDHTKNILVVGGGSYTIRMAPVASNGTVGILSNPVFVEVDMAATVITSISTLDSDGLTEPAIAVPAHSHTEEVIPIITIACWSVPLCSQWLWDRWLWSKEQPGNIKEWATQLWHRIRRK